MGGSWSLSVTCSDNVVHTLTNILNIAIGLIDPSGYVYDANTNARIGGAQVALLYKDPNLGNVFWNAALYNQLNTQRTGPHGQYGWNVPAGQYFVTVVANCYQPVTSGVVTIPPPVTTLNIGLQPVAGCGKLFLPLVRR